MKIYNEKIESGLKTVVDLGRNRGASGVKAVYTRNDTNSCSFKNGTLKEINSRDTESISVSVITGGRQGVSVVSDLGDVSIALEMAFNIAKVGKKAYFDEYPMPEQYAGVKLYSPEIDDMPLGDFIGENEKLCAEMNKLDKDLFIENGGGKKTGFTAIAHSGGLYYQERNSSWNHSCWGNKTEEGDLFWVGDSTGWRSAENGISIDPVIESCREVYDMSLELTEIEEGYYPVVFDPDTVKLLMRIITSGVNGKTVHEGSSPLRDKIGMRILDPSINVIDDPQRDYGPEAVKHDSDGIPTRVLPVIENGVLRSFAYDLNTAALCNTLATGHTDSMLHCPVVLPGSTHSRDIIKGIKRGILVKMLLGFGQGNIVNGDFSGNLGSGFLIEDGEIKGRVKNTMIAGNFYELAKHNVLLSSDIHRLNRQPYMTLDGVKVSAK